MNDAVARGSSGPDGPTLPEGVSVVHNEIHSGTFNGTVVQGGIVHITPLPEVTWPVVVGDLPVLAGAFQPRTAVRERITAARTRLGTVVLSQVLAGGGGVGKSQLAADYAHRALADGTEVLVWARATDRLSVLQAYAEAGRLVRAPGMSGDAEATEQDARRFLNWLSGTERRWLVVLDDVVDFTAAGPPWPGSSRSGNGRVLATTRQRGAHVSGGGRALVPVDVYEPAEARDYLAERLAGAGLPQLLDEGADELVDELGRLPLALAHAAAYMANQLSTCTRYLELFRERTRTLDSALPPDADTEGYGRPVTAALLISLDAAQRTEPRGLAAPAVRLAALLDPAGHPRALWTTGFVRKHLAEQRAATAAPPTNGVLTTGLPTNGAEADGAEADGALPDGAGADGAPKAGRRSWWPGRRSRAAARTPAARATERHGQRGQREQQEQREQAEQPPVSADEALAVLAVLHTYNLIDSLPAGGSAPHLPTAARHREVTIHALTARAARDTDPDPWQSRLEAAFALHELWPATEHADRRLSASLRTNTTVLEGHLGEDRHTFPAFVLHDRVGLSLLHAGMGEAAVAHWTEDVEYGDGALAEDDPQRISSRSNLAAAHLMAGNADRAVEIATAAVVLAARHHGPDSALTRSVEARLGTALDGAGRLAEAVKVKEFVLAQHERLSGPHHPDTVSARNSLAVSYSRVGRDEEALALRERAVADRAAFGDDSPQVLTLRLNLAHSHARQGGHRQAVQVTEEVVAARGRLLGADHPDTLTARASLASFYEGAGRAEESFALGAAVLADLERVLGPDHPDTLTARADLAVSHRRAGRTEQAVTLSEQVLRTRLRRLGLEHPDTLLSAGNLVNCYAQQGRTERALRLAEWVQPVKRRVLGDAHELTVTGRHAVAALHVRRATAVVDRDPVGAAEDAAAALAALDPAMGPPPPDLDLLRGAATRLAARARAAAGPGDPDGERPAGG